MKFPKITKWDVLAIIALIVFVILVSIPVYKDKEGCEVARPGYKCASAKDVMIEHCAHWAKWECPHCGKDEWKTCADPSLPNVEWYIENLCNVHNDLHKDKFDCSNLKLACNQASGEVVCPIGV
ncbi:MAG: hypothetical protein ISS95_00945 [Candidatus Aenigmarchaeota archaeon]|nr:hypothetical protein [Candidatus Aenigmarchaeota archaeon]